MNLQTISEQMLIETYGTHSDGIWIYNNHKQIGFITDLRVAYAKNQKKRITQKLYSNRVNEKRNDEMPQAVDNIKMFLETHLSKIGAKVFINISQPNVHLNSCKCYIIVDPIYNKHSLGIQHAYMDYNDMAQLMPGYHCSPSSSNKHILFRGLSQDDIIETIKLICKKNS